MAENTSIEWCHHTFNPWIGCTKVHAGCANCYAEADFDKRRHKAKWGPRGTRVITSAAYWAKPLKWQRDAAAAGVRERVFCASLADVFEDWDENLLNHHEYVDGRNLDDARVDLFRLIDQTPDLDWLLLTKRPENIRPMWCSPRAVAGGTRFRPNVWLLTSVSDQATADTMIPRLIECRDYAPVLGISAEPLLGQLDLTQYLGKGGLDWVISGGESGPNARPSAPLWHRQLRDQCFGAGVPFFFKQWGEWGSILGQPLEAWTTRDDKTFGAITPGGHFMPKSQAKIGQGDPIARFGKKQAGRLLDGKTHDAVPAFMPEAIA